MVKMLEEESTCAGMQKACVFFIFGTDLFSKCATTLARCNGDKHSLRKFVLQVVSQKFFSKKQPV